MQRNVTYAVGKEGERERPGSAKKKMENISLLYKLQNERK